MDIAYLKNYKAANIKKIFQRQITFVSKVCYIRNFTIHTKKVQLPKKNLRCIKVLKATNKKFKGSKLKLNIKNLALSFDSTLRNTLKMRCFSTPLSYETGP